VPGSSPALQWIIEFWIGKPIFMTQPWRQLTRVSATVPAFFLVFRNENAPAVEPPLRAACAGLKPGATMDYRILDR